MYELLKNQKTLKILKQKPCWTDFSTSIEYIFKNKKEIAPKEIKSIFRHLKYGKYLNTSHIEKVYIELCLKLQTFSEDDMKNNSKLVGAFKSLIILENESHKINSMDF